MIHHPCEKKNIRGYTFWCDTCKVGTYLGKMTEAHNIGKKHKRKEENKTCSIVRFVLSPMKPQFIQIVEHLSDVMISGKKSEEGSHVQTIKINNYFIRKDNQCKKQINDCVKSQYLNYFCCQVKLLLPVLPLMCGPVY